MSTFSEIIRSRKSIRTFGENKISSDVIKKIIEAATYAPTNCNQQLWNFIVVTDVQMKERLIKEAASNTLLRRAPVLIVITYDGWNRKEALQGGSLALGHLLFAAEEQGLSALPMNSYGADSQVKRLLEIPKSEIICCFVALGYPDEKAKKSLPISRRPVSEVLHWDTFKKRTKPSFVYDPESWNLDSLKDHQKYYCRKTSSGKEMDIMSDYERVLVRKSLMQNKGAILDVCTYDGAYIKEFPNTLITTLDLTQETSFYTKAATELFVEKKLTHKVYDENSQVLTENSVDLITLIYKAERLPSALRTKLFKQSYQTLTSKGEILIISRKKNIFLSFFFGTIKILFGSDIRKTGIYTFFGPYKPLLVKDVVSELKTAGFKDINWSGYFLFPTFYEQVYQMFLQYRYSEGSSYLHREKRVSFVTKIISFLVQVQGFFKVGYFGSVVVIRAKK